MKKKVGIMTFHRAINYGAVLQAYALNRKINELGFDCTTIDYACEAVDIQYRYRGRRTCTSWKNFVAHNLTCLLHWKKKARMESFRKKIPQSPKCDQQTIAEVAAEYDILVTGSDQVFNPECHRDDPAYYLNFAKEQKKVAYAASLGSIASFMNSRLNTTALLSDFTKLSFREADATEHISNQLARKCQTLVDPVWLLSKDEWCEVTGKKKPNQFIFVYNLMDYPYMCAFVKKLRQLTGYQVVAASRTIMGDAMYAECARNVSNCSPEDFLAFIRDAQYVVTDSFHGASFSILMQRPFFAALNPASQNTNSRISNILKTAGLESRSITRESVPHMDCDIDWNRVEQNMSSQIQESIRFLMEVDKCEV